MKRASGILLLLLTLLAGVWLSARAGWFTLPGTSIVDPRQLGLSSTMGDVLSSDPRNAGIEMSANYLGLGSDVLVLDLEAATSPIDVFRVVWQLAAELTDSHFSEVRFVSDGTHHFTLSGKKFAWLGAVRERENPIFVMRIFPESLTRPDGSPAFPTWEGGMLGVSSKQMEDFATFVRQWYASAP